MSPTTTGPRILVFSGSARTGSHNTRLAELARRALAAAGARPHPVNLREFALPLYDGDIQAAQGIPDAAHRFAELLREHDGVVIVSPEYNYSMPGTVKNLIDWVSRIKPWPTIGVNGLLMSASPSAVGGHRGLIALRVPLEGIGARLHPDMFTLAFADKAYGDDGELADAGSRDRLRRLVSDFLDVVAATVHYRRSRELVTEG